MSKEFLNSRNERISRSQKEKDNQQWYKDKINSLYKTRSNAYFRGDTDYISGRENDELLNMKVNYDLYNGIMNFEELSYICKPFGSKGIGEKFSGQGPVRMSNKDIVSNKIKVILGLEMKRPLDYTVLAVNPEATTRKEKEMTDRIKEFVTNSIMLPVKRELEIRRAQEEEGREFTPQEKEQLDLQLQEEMKTMTPEEVKLYMEREHQDPAEIQANHLLKYLSQKTDAKRKFNEGCKHAALVAKEAYWVGENRGHPDFRVLDDMRRATYDKSPGVTFFEDGEYFTYEYLWSPSQVISFFGDDLTDYEVDRIYSLSSSQAYLPLRGNGDIDFSNSFEDESNSGNLVSVFHATWKSLRELCILSYYDEETEEVLKKVVDEKYKINPEIGDIEIKREWIPEAYEGYLINGGIYKKMRPIPGQFRDLDNISECKLSYYGAVYDSTNSKPTSIMDRGKPFLYFNNIVNYRIETLMASDKGKKIALSYKSIPMEDGLDLEDFIFYSENSPFMFLDPSEEGASYNDVNMAAKVMDLSLMSDIARYIEISKDIKESCGEAMGVSRQMEAQIQNGDAVNNTRQAIVQNSYILEPFFNLHNLVKRNVLEALLQCAKVVYRDKKPETLSYVLDDMSFHMFSMEVNYISNSTLGLYISDSSKAQDIKDTLTNLAHAALQNQQIKLSDVLSIIKEDSIEAAEDRLVKSEKEMQELKMQQQREAQESQEKLQAQLIEAENKKHQNALELAKVKEEERRKTIIVQSSIMGASFNPDRDIDNDGINDFLELARHNLDVDIRERKQALEEKKFEAKQKNDEEKINLEKLKIKQANEKVLKPKS